MATASPAPTVATTGPAQPAEVTFDSGNLKLRGFIYRPVGAGPFPAVLWNHGSDRLPGWLPEIGELFTRQGYVFFVPHRRGQGRSADQGEYIVDLLDKESRERGPDARSKLLVMLHDYDLTPGRTLAAEMGRPGKPNRLRIFPAFGATAQDGHAFGVRGGEVWGPEVFLFLSERLKQ